MNAACCLSDFKSMECHLGLNTDIHGKNSCASPWCYEVLQWMFLNDIFLNIQAEAGIKDLTEMLNVILHQLTSSYESMAASPLSLLPFFSSFLLCRSPLLSLSDLSVWHPGCLQLRWLPWGISFNDLSFHWIPPPSLHHCLKWHTKPGNLMLGNSKAPSKIGCFFSLLFLLL